MICHEASYYETKEKGKVKCLLCPHHCLLKEGQSGTCHVRMNRNGKLVTLIHNRITALSMDPIEKKPLYHFYPGSEILSIGTAGCNFHCSFCQNWEISQGMNRDMIEVMPQSLLHEARSKGSVGIAFTYSEPVIWIETVKEVGKVFKDAGLANVLVTNGFIDKEPLQEILPLIDAMNIDVKAFTEGFYQKNCKGKLDPVKRNVEFLYDKTHLELTTLVIPGLNDSESEINSLCKWIASLDPCIPVHFSRYHPAYKMTLPVTPESVLKRIYEQARSHLKYVYVGNIHIPGAEDTFCPHCGEKLIERTGFKSSNVGLDGNKCLACGNIPERIVF